MHSIYKITNLITGKSYVGFTSREPSIRWSKHKTAAVRGQDGQLYDAIRKHGLDAFVFEVIETDIVDKQEALDQEVYYIDRFNTFKEGYNATLGGTGGDMSEYETYRTAIKEWHSKQSPDFYAKRGMLGKTHTEESKEAQSLARKKHWDSMSIEERASRGDKVSGQNNGMYGKVPPNATRVEFDGTEYDSIADASRKTGKSCRFIKKHGRRL